VVEAPKPAACAAPEPTGESFAFLGLAPPANKSSAPTAVLEAPTTSMRRVLAETDLDTAVHESVAKLIEELSLCRRYYEATFSNAPVQRMVFTGGEANQRGMCQQIARELGLAAQIGDPMVRISKFSDAGIESAIDRRKPQPAWAVAIGLSMGAFNPDTPQT
jgi:Tfp pilus assembly PilM family ATPase